MRSGTGGSRATIDTVIGHGKIESVMKKYALVAFLALAVLALLDVLATWYFSDRVIVNPTQQFTLFMNVVGIATAIVKFASVATLVGVGVIGLKRSVQNNRRLVVRHHR